MAESKKISGLPEITSPSVSGITVVVENGTTYKTSLSNLRSSIASGATETSAGVARLATYGETSGGTDNTTIITPAKLKYYNDLQSQENDPMDSRYYDGEYPWSSVQSVNSGITASSRYTGLTVNVNGYEYWYKNGISNSSLVPKLNSVFVTTTGSTIYVATTGNSITGDGSINSPYATLDRALEDLVGIYLNHDVTISLGAGTFILSGKSEALLASLMGAGTVTIRGDQNDIRTVTHDDHNDLNRCQIDLIDTGMTVNAYKHMWAYDDEFAFKRVNPIFENGSNFLICPTGYYFNPTHIIDTNTRLQIPSTITNFEPKGNNGVCIQFELIEFYAETQVKMTFRGNVNLLACRFYIFRDGTWDYDIYPSLDFERDYIGWVDSIIYDTVMYYYPQSSNEMRYILGDYQYSDFPSTAGGIHLIGLGSFYGGLINGYKWGIRISAGGVFNISLGWAGWMFKNLETAIGVHKNSRVHTLELNKIYFDSSLTYVLDDFNIDGGVSIQLWDASIQGAYTGLTKLNGTIPYTSVKNDIHISIPGVYPEFDSIDDTTFTDSGTTYTIIGDTVQNRSVTIDYTLVRGTGCQMGTMQVLYDGSSVYYFDSAIDNGPDLGVTLTADINSTEIRLVATTTSTGNDVTFKGQVKRIMI